MDINWSDMEGVPEDSGSPNWSDMESGNINSPQSDAISKTSGDYVFDGIGGAVNAVKNADYVGASNWLADKETGIAKRAVKGAMDASNGIESLAANALEGIWNTGKAAVYAAKGDYKNFKYDSPITDSIKLRYEEANNVIEPSKEQDSGVARGIERVVSVAPDVAFIGKAIISRGAKLLSNPELLKVPAEGANIASKSWVKARRAMQDMAMTAAKDPKEYLKLEQKISAISVMAANQAVEQGLPEGYRLPAEIVLAIVSSSGSNAANSVGDIYHKYANPAKFKERAKDTVRDYIKSIKKEYDDHAIRTGDSSQSFDNRHLRGKELEKDSGIKLNSGEMLDSPELKHAQTELEIRETGGSTSDALRQKESAMSIRENYKADLSVSDKGIDEAKKEASDIRNDIENTRKSLTDKINNIVDNTSSLSVVESGNSGRIILNEAEIIADKEVKEIWKKVGDPNIPIDDISKSVKQIMKSDLNDYNRLMDVNPDLRRLIEKHFLGVKANADRGLIVGKNGIPLSETIKPKDMNLKGIQVIESKIKESLRKAKADGSSGEVKVLSELLNSIFKQYEKIPASAVKDVSALRAAQIKTRGYHEVFSQGENLLASKVDKQGFDKITSEGFIHNYIKPNKQAVGARSEEAVDNFYNAVGKSHESKAWMENSFGSLLKEKFPNMQASDAKRVSTFINSYSRFLEKAGISNRFNTIGKAMQKASAADKMLVANERKFMDSALSKLVNSDSPRDHIASLLKGSKIDDLMSNISKIKDKSRREYIIRGVRETAWEDMIKSATSSKKIDGVHLFDTSSITKALTDPRYANNFNKLFGKGYKVRAKNFIDIISRTKSEFYDTHGISKEKIDEELVGKLMTGLRAAAHGFVRPDLIAAQMAYRAGSVIGLKEQLKILKEALDNPELLMKLSKESNTYEGRKLVKSMFFPTILSSSINEKDNK